MVYNGDMPRMTITLSDDLYRRLKAEADQNNNSINGEIGHCLSLYFAQKTQIEIVVNKVLWQARNDKPRMEIR